MAESERLTPVQWTVCVIAAIGFAFDIYELLMLPLVVGPALAELGGLARGTPEFARWFGLLFYVPAVCGGIFGLLGGYLTDRFGRRRVLTWSILLYAFSAFFAGYSTNLWMLLFFRTTTFIGVCVEFVAAVAWLAELFDNPVRREKVLGYTQAFSSFGGLLVAIVNGLVVRHALELPAIHMPGFLESLLGTIAPAGEHAAWRYTLMSGLIPAIPLIIIRPFLPESPKWQARAILAGVPAGDAAHDNHVRGELRRGIRGDSADAPDCSGAGHGAGKSCSRDGRQAGTGGQGARRPDDAGDRRQLHQSAGNGRAVRAICARDAGGTRGQSTAVAANVFVAGDRDVAADLLGLFARA